jgi:hypothetical protein
MLRADSLSDITAIPRDQAGSVEVISAGELQLNGVKWNNQDYVLVGAEGDNLLAVPYDSLDMSRAVVVPKTAVREGERAQAQVGDYEFQVRQIEIEGQGTLDLIEAGPNIELSTVFPAENAASATSFRSTSSAASGCRSTTSEVEQYTLKDNPEARYLVIEQTDWRPVIGLTCCASTPSPLRPASSFPKTAVDREQGRVQG